MQPVPAVASKDENKSLSQIVFYTCLPISFSLHFTFGLNVFFIKIALIVFFYGMDFFGYNAGCEGYCTRFYVA
jgi:hypothetical protein